jgi:hypothetical protein
MGADGTRKRQWEADNSLIGPASRALAAPARTTRRRLPSVHGSAFDEEERSTDSEIDNVLGGIKSVPPKPLSRPVIAAAEAAPAASASEPPVSPQPPHVQGNPARHESKDERSPIEPLETHSPPMRAGAGPVANVIDPPKAQLERALRGRRRRQVIVLTAVFGLGATVLALAAARHVARGPAAGEETDGQRAAAVAPAPAPTVSSVAPSLDGPAQATPTVPANGATAQPPAAAPKPNAASRRPPSKRGSRPSSI